tara:strand:+ start:1587 stop:1754 length:168 start_codon:yes stop_codon:yes gene_type:complete
MANQQILEQLEIIGNAISMLDDTLGRIADVLEGDTSLEDYANMQNHIVNLTKEEA